MKQEKTARGKGGMQRGYWVTFQYFHSPYGHINRWPLKNSTTRFSPCLTKLEGSNKKGTEPRHEPPVLVALAIPRPLCMEWPMPLFLFKNNVYYKWLYIHIVANLPSLEDGKRERKITHSLTILKYLLLTSWRYKKKMTVFLS